MCVLKVDRALALAEVHDAMSRLCADHGFINDAVAHTRQAIKVLHHRFAWSDIELGYEYFKLAQLCFAAHDSKGALNAVGIAKRVLVPCLGDSNEQVLELTAMERALLVPHPEA